MSNPTIKCSTFRCRRYGDHRCCVGCRDPCEDRCLNHPDRCKLVATSKARPLAENPQRVLELYEQGLTDAEIADAMDVTAPAVCKWRQRHGLGPN